MQSADAVNVVSIVLMIIGNILFANLAVNCKKKIKNYERNKNIFEK